MTKTKRNRRRRRPSVRQIEETRKGEDEDEMQAIDDVTASSSTSGQNPVEENQGKRKRAKHNLPPTKSPDPVEEKELRDISEGPDPIKTRNRSKTAKHVSLPTNSPELVEQQGPVTVKEKCEKSKRARCNFLSMNCSEPVAAKHVGNMLEGTSPVKEGHKESKRTKHGLSPINSLEPVKEKDQSSILVGPDLVKKKQRKRSIGSNYSLPSANSRMPVVEKDLNNRLQEKCEIHSAKESPTLESLVNENLDTALETENTSAVVKKAKMKKHSAPENHYATQNKLKKGSPCNPDKKNIESLEQDQTSSLLETAEIYSARNTYHEASMGSNLTTLVEIKHNVLLENMGTDSMENNVPPEVNAKMITSFKQARGEDSQIDKKKYHPSENYMESIKDDDPTTSLQVVQESPVDSASISCSNKVYSLKKKKKKKAECTVHVDKVHKDSSSSDLLHEGHVKKSADELTTQNPLEKGTVCNLDQTNSESLEQDKTSSLLQIAEINSARKTYHESSISSNLTSLVEMTHPVLSENMGTDSMKNNASPEMNSLDMKSITGSLKAREDNLIEMKKNHPSENDMESIKDADPTTSLQAVQDSPVASAPISCLKLNQVYASKKKKKRAEWSVHEDKAHQDSSTSDLLHGGLVKKSAPESTTVQIEVEKCNASEKGKMEVSLADCKEEASPSLSPVYIEDVTSLDLGSRGTSLQVVDTGAMDILAAGCGDKELASTRKCIIKELKSTIYEDKSVNGAAINDLPLDYLLQKNGEVLSNFPSAVPDCDITVEANLESCSTDCQKEANNIENGANKQDKLLGVSMSPERAPVNCSRRKLLILDLNGLLVDIVHFEPNWRTPDTKVAGRSVYKRPFCEDFLKFCFERFDVGIWSSRIKKNLLAVVNFLMGDDKDKLLFFWDQSQCTVTGFTTVENRNKPLFLKELKKIWDKEEPNLRWEKGEYTPSNTLLLDDSPYKALRNPPYTAIFPRPYCFKDENDNSLGPGGDLRVYLEGLAKSDDVPRYVQEHPFGQRAITSANPSWPFYLKVIGVENSLAPAL